MKNTFSYNKISTNEINDNFRSTQKNKNSERKVDINTLLNRVKLNENNKRKNNIILFITSLLSLFVFIYLIIS